VGEKVSSWSWLFLRGRSWASSPAARLSFFFYEGKVSKGRSSKVQRSSAREPKSWSLLDIEPLLAGLPLLRRGWLSLGAIPAVDRCSPAPDRLSRGERFSKVPANERAVLFLIVVLSRFLHRVPVCVHVGGPAVPRRRQIIFIRSPIEISR